MMWLCCHIPDHVCEGLVFSLLKQLGALQIVAQNQGQTQAETRHQFSRMLLGMADMPAVLVHLADRLQVSAASCTCSTPSMHGCAAVRGHDETLHVHCPVTAMTGSCSQHALQQHACDGCSWACVPHLRHCLADVQCRRLVTSCTRYSPRGLTHCQPRLRSFKSG